MQDRFISSRDKVWRTESTNSRPMASAMWQECKRLNIPVRGKVEGQQYRVVMYCTEWTAWRVLNAGRLAVAGEVAPGAAMTQAEFRKVARKAGKALEVNQTAQKSVYAEIEALRDLMAVEFSHSVRHELAMQESEKLHQLNALKADADLLRKVNWTQNVTTLQAEFIHSVETVASETLQKLELAAVPV